MGIFDRLFSGRRAQATKHFPVKSPAAFRQMVEQVIGILANPVTGDFENEVLVDELVTKGLDEDSAVAIALFLPIAFVRELYPMIKWPTVYTRLDDKGRGTQWKYDDNEAYQVILSVSKAYLGQAPDEEVLLNILWRSAEYKLIDHQLTINPDAQLDKLSISPTVMSY